MWSAVARGRKCRSLDCGATAPALGMTSEKNDRGPETRHAASQREDSRMSLALPGADAQRLACVLRVLCRYSFAWSGTDTRSLVAASITRCATSHLEDSGTSMTS